MKRATLAIILFPIFLMPAFSTEVDAGAEVVFGTGIIKPNIGIDINKIYTGFIIESTGSGLFISLNLGGAYKLTTRDLGSVLLFHVSVGFGHRFGSHRVSIIFDHISNADFVSYNPGLNIFGIRYGYSFGGIHD